MKICIMVRKGFFKILCMVFYPWIEEQISKKQKLIMKRNMNEEIEKWLQIKNELNMKWINEWMNEWKYQLFLPNQFSKGR